MKRRRFISLGAGVGAAAMAGFRLRAAKPSDIDLALSNPDAKPEVARQPILVRAGLSRFIDGTEAPKKGQQTLVRSFDSEGRLAALVVPPAPGESFRGAPLHVHHDVDEWLYILAGEFVAEVGGKRMRLKTGDSLLMPMKIPTDGVLPASREAAPFISIHRQAAWTLLSTNPQPRAVRHLYRADQSGLRKLWDEALGHPADKGRNHADRLLSRRAPAPAPVPLCCFGSTATPGCALFSRFP